MVRGEGGAVWVGYQQALWLGAWTIHRTLRPAALTLTARVTRRHPVWADLRPFTAVAVQLGPWQWRWDSTPTVEGDTVTLAVTERPRVSRSLLPSFEGETV